MANPVNHVGKAADDDNNHMAAEPSGRWRRLKDATEQTHDRLDHRIMAAEPFASRERYGRFVLVQHAFHRDIDALYSNADLTALFADLASRRRLGAIVQDLADLGLTPTAQQAPTPFATEVDIPSAVGWLYVAEGSNLGAAFLLKAAARLGFDESCGARHLAAAPEGRGLSWRKFTTALDAIPLTSDAEERVFAGARAAFSRVHALVEATLPAVGTPATEPDRIPSPQGALSTP